MITVTAMQVLKPGKEAELRALMVDLTAKVKANEPGCATFDWVHDDANPQNYLVIEQYVDQQAYDLHGKTQYLKDFIPKLMGVLQQAPAVTIYGDVVEPPPIAPASYFHIGVVVPDLEQAIARYSDVLGIKFAEPATFNIPRLEDPDPHPGTLVAAFSMTQPPYYELIQAAGNGIISASNAGRILYFACWEADMAGRLARLKKQKVGVDALFRMDAVSPPFAMITAPDLLGARIEYVDESDRAPIEEWARTGKYPGGIGQQ
jgi:quinol monooxygenase YgiN/catechol 2,3-dioxygenase-like lactoylglutathione lyase family enzyme